MSTQGRLEQVNAVIERIMSDWYERLRQHYVTDEDSRELGLEPEVKYFREFGSHRIKFSRKGELDVTYGLAAEQKNGSLVVVSSVNNKSQGFDYDRFVEKLKLFYWASRNEKPWTHPDIDHFAYGDLVKFEPRMGQSVSLDIRKDKADILRLAFQIVPEHEALLLSNQELFRDLVENYCLNPLKRIYAESYRQC
ncbi:MAG: hypothetical protein Kow001_20230 [Acidobacteriota bacterium]